MNFLWWMMNLDTKRSLVTQDLILDWYHVLDGFGIKLLFIYNQKLKDSRLESF